MGKKKSSGNHHRSSKEIINVAMLTAKVARLESTITEFNGYRRAETDFIVDLMFGLQGVHASLTDSSSLRLVKGALEKFSDDVPVTVKMLKEIIQEFPMLSDVQVLTAKAKARSDYMATRKPHRLLMHLNETKSATEWAETLGLNYDEFEVLLAEKGSISDLVIFMQTDMDSEIKEVADKAKAALEASPT